LEVDYIIVGQGFAGSFFAAELLLNHKTFAIIDADKNKASSIAAGVYNPVILKRFTPIWEADEQIDFFIEKMKVLEEFFQTKFLIEEPILRIIDNPMERKTWVRKARNKLKYFLDSEIIEEKANIKSAFGLGKVLQSGRIHSTHFLSTLKNHCKDFILNEDFYYSEIKFDEKQIKYYNITAKYIVFCDGMSMVNNPFFNTIPIKTNKGECLTAILEKPLEKFIFKKKYFLFQETENQYYIGGTNDSEDFSIDCTEKIKQELIQSVAEIYTSNITIIEQKAAIRPTTFDRRPIVGKHRNHENIFLINGLGTRGALLGAKCAQSLFENIEYQKPIQKEIDVNRFY